MKYKFMIINFFVFLLYRFKRMSYDDIVQHVDEKSTM